MECVTMNTVKPKVLSPGMYAIDVEPIPPRNRNNREVHLDYLKHLKESVETVCEIVKEARIEKPLDNALENACFYTKRSQELLEYMIGTCPKEFNKSDKKAATTPLNRNKQTTFRETCETSNNNTQTRVEKQKVHKTIWKPTRRKFTLEEQCPLPRFTKSKVVPLQQPEHVSSSKIVITERFSNTIQKPLTRYTRRNKQEKAISNGIPTIAETQSMDASVKYTTIVQIVLWNDHFGAIMGYGDYVIGDSVISRVYYVEGLGHNLFSVGQSCDSDLEVAFRKHSSYVRDVDGVELLIGCHGSNLYTISIEDMMKSSPICLLSKASKNKSWLWHHRLNHLNFGTINDLARKDLVRGLPRLKFEKDHLCSACQLGKSKKYTHKPKSENIIIEVLHTLHMDLCEPMRVQSINGKKYILVIVDDYLRFTYVKFFRSKDETPEYQSKPTKKHLEEIKRVFRYLRGTINMGLWYPKDTAMKLTAYADANHASCQDTRRNKMVEENVPALIRTDEQLVPVKARLPIGKCNLLMDLQKNFQLDADLLRDALGITLKDFAHPFVAPPIGDLVIDFVNNLGYLKELQFVSKMYVNNDYSLGNLKFVPKGELDEVFGMPIPKDLITDVICNSEYYQKYLDMAAHKPRQATIVTDEEGGKKKKVPLAKKISKPSPSKKIRKGKVMKVHKGKRSDHLVDEEDEEDQPASEPQVEDDEYNLQRGIQMSVESFQAPVGGVAIREPC
ncbi:retrovirus-related pol polyprotein from transposon TNT 1-94 [Tanacetum coccineum]